MFIKLVFLFIIVLKISSMKTTQMKLGTSNIGRSIILLADLHQNNNNELLNALNNLKTNLIDNINKETKSYQSYQIRNQEDVNYFRSRINQKQYEIANLQIELKKLDKTLSWSEQNILAKKQEVNDANQQKKQLNYFQEQENKLYDSQFNVFNKGLLIIDQAIDLIEKAKNPSFIETHFDTYQILAENLQQELLPQYKQISFTLIQISEDKFASHEIIRKTTRILQKLRGSIQDQLIENRNQKNWQESSNDQLIQLYDNKIDQLQNNLIKQLEDDHLTLMQSYQTKKQLLDQFQQILYNNQQQFQEVSQESEKVENIFTELLKEYQIQIQIINDALNELQNKQQ